MTFLLVFWGYVNWSPWFHLICQFSLFFTN